MTHSRRSVLGSGLLALAALAAPKLAAAQRPGHRPKPSQDAVPKPAAPWTGRFLSEDGVRMGTVRLVYPYVTWSAEEQFGAQTVSVFLHDLRSGETKRVSAQAISSRVSIGPDCLIYCDDHAWWRYDIATSDAAKILDMPPEVRWMGSPFIANGLAAFEAPVGAGGRWHLCTYDLATRKLTQATEDNASAGDITTDGRTVAWVASLNEEKRQGQHPLSRQVFAWDVASRKTTQVSADADFNDSRPAVAGKHLLWRRNPVRGDPTGNVCDLMLHDLATGRTKTLHEGSLNEFALDGGTVAWTAHEDPVIHRYVLATGRKSEPIPAPGFMRTELVAGDGLLCWRATVDPSHSRSITYVFDGTSARDVTLGMRPVATDEKRILFEGAQGRAFGQNHRMLYMLEPKPAAAGKRPAKPNPQGAKAEAEKREGKAGGRQGEAEGRRMRPAYRPAAGAARRSVRRPAQTAADRVPSPAIAAPREAAYASAVECVGPRREPGVAERQTLRT